MLKCGDISKDGYGLLKEQLRLSVLALAIHTILLTNYDLKSCSERFLSLFLISNVIGWLERCHDEIMN